MENQIDIEAAIVIRRGAADDASALLNLVDALADYEKLDRPTAAARQRLVVDLFGPKPRLDCWLALLGNDPVGYAFTFETYSSFLALPTLYLEDLFVLPGNRGRKVGYTLFHHVINEAKRRGCGRVEWTALDWNRLASEFYRKVGGERLEAWHMYRIALADGS